MKIKSNLAFTLIELMIVVAIIGLLTAIAVPKFANLVVRAKEANTKGNLGAIRSSLMIYYADISRFPTWNDVTYAPCNGKPKVTCVLAEGGKYLSKYSLFSFRSEHPDRDGVEGTDDGTTYFSDESGEIDECGWIYNTENSPSFGTFYVYCTHEDSRGYDWDSY